MIRYVLIFILVCVLIEGEGRIGQLEAERCPTTKPRHPNPTAPVSFRRPHLEER